MKNRLSLYSSLALIALFIILFIVSLSAIACAADSGQHRHGPAESGALSVQGTALCAEDGSPVILRGLSSHGLSWFPEYTNYATLCTLRDYGANAFRIAVYPAQNDGYLEEPKLNEKLLSAAIENALAADLYVIVDWHVLQDENPLKHKEEAKRFFENVARRYGQEPGILYEICNEPNGNTSWRDIRSYAAEIIPLIRSHAPDAVILVGTPNFCTTLEQAIQTPLSCENVMYTYHYYSSVSDCRYARSQINKALDNGLPVFVSEWGYQAESPTLSKDTEALDTFMDFLEEQDISWINWALSNKDESYSFLAPDCETLSGWTEEQLSPSGRYVISRLHQ